MHARELCNQSLFMDKIMKNKKYLGLVTSLSFICKTCLENLIFWYGSLNLETLEREEKKTQNIEYLKTEKSFSNKIKTIVLKWFLLVKYKD